MLLAREFMRLAALEALRPSALLGTPTPAWPTIAGDYVYDSRIDPIEDLSDLQPNEKRPICAAFTEDTALTKIAQAGPQFYKGEVDLVFEISVVAQFQRDDQTLIIDYADTDAAVEATLGSLEDQIFHALHYAPAGALFRQMVKLPFKEWHSTVKRAGEENIRFAARTVRTKIDVREACYVGSPSAAATGLDRLPPVLRDIAQQLAGSTYLHDLALGMAAVAPQMPVRTLLQSVGLVAQRHSDDRPLAAGSATNLQE